MIRIVYLAIGVLLIVSCGSKREVMKGVISLEEKQQIPNKLSGILNASENELIEIGEIFSLTEIQKKTFLEYFKSPLYKNIASNQRISNYLLTRLKGFNYYSDTLIASKALQENKGNCLSLAIVTTSLADLVGVDASYDLVETRPVYKRINNTIASSQHVNTVLYETSSENPLIPANITIDYFPGLDSRTLRSVSRNEFYAMYYLNIATEYFLKRDFVRAYYYVDKALKINPHDAVGLNLLALIHDEYGYSNSAEKIFKIGLNVTGDKLVLLNNYYNYLIKQNRLIEAKAISAEIIKYEDFNPFPWMSLGNKAFNNEQYSRALRFYKRALSLAPYLIEAKLQVARVLVKLDRKFAAKEYLEDELTRSENRAEQERYAVKLKIIESL